ncbi:MAG: DUF2959 domain-containing protein [Deltaproteobacteria bacterium]|nr:DUF2959 domain-containing protein [Deltaproteobacteria bacterium]
MVALILFLWLPCLVGCQTTYYAFWEKLGKEKRHLFKDNVEKVRSEQQKASEEFKDALTRVKEIYGFKGGDLEEFYERLRDDYEACERRAASVRERIEMVERIAADLFKEWEEEIGEMGNAKLKSNSRQSLQSTRKRYARLSRAMTKAESRMEPTLRHLRDYVLYLKHNLNAQAIGVLQKEVNDIEIEVEALVKDMTKSISEADEFLKTLK